MCVLILAMHNNSSIWHPSGIQLSVRTILADVELLEVQQLSYTGRQEHHIILTQIKVFQ